MPVRTPRKALFCFCMGPGSDRVSRDVFDRASRLFPLQETADEVDGLPVMEYRDSKEDRFLFMRQDNLISYDFARFLPLLTKRFGDVDAAVEVNWHAGDNAPDRVLTVHSLGDVPSGRFFPSEPRWGRNLLLGLERQRGALGLEDFAVVTEATHWSGTVHGGDTSDILKYPVPFYDVEIGSTPDSWGRADAVEVLARGIVEIFREDGPVWSLLCLGGVHFEPSFTAAALRDDLPLALGHVLPNQWLVSGRYEEPEGWDKLSAAASAVRGDIAAVVYHEGLKAAYRDLARRWGEASGVPVLKHKALRSSDLLEHLRGNRG